MKTITMIEETPISGLSLLEASAGSSSPYYRFSAILQTADTVNKNRRVYPSNILREEIIALQPRIKNSDLLGELDHPFIESADPSVMMRRQHIVMYERVSHKINNLRMDNNAIVGELETLKTEKGRTLAGLIESGVKVGFSLRAFGNVKMRHDGVYEVTKPFKIITWDAVSNPSHSDARLIEISENTIKEAIAESLLLEDVGSNIDILLGLVEDFEFLNNDKIMSLINRHFDILYELTNANLKMV